jgi:hydroxymethylpyrimidine/phosphomethylpyrimidine kinase
MKTYPVVLTIAGSDSGGGAGIQADLKTMSALGVFGLSAITAVTAQNTLGVRVIHSVPCDVLEAQIEAVMSDFNVAAVKVGMINHSEAATIIANAIKKYKPKHVVIDPVMVATSGAILIEEHAVEQLKKQLFPLADVITPNLNETSILLGRIITNQQEMEDAAKALCDFGCKSALVKGGHLQTGKMTDVLWLKEENKACYFSSPKIETNNLHGTGCTLSSAIATFLTSGDTVPQAVEHAKDYIYKAIEAGKNIKTGKGNGPINHFFAPQKMKIIDPTPQNHLEDR